MSKAMKGLQERIGVAADGDFGPTTAKAIVKHYELSPKQGAHLLGQAHHESGGFKTTTESLYYTSAERIQAVWPSRFETVEYAERYTKNAKALADKVYGGRLGNNGEGFLWRGRGFLQITGRDNYRMFAADMRLPKVMDAPDLCSTDYAFETALWFFRTNSLFRIADAGVDDETIRKITKRVNGGHHGLDDRITQTNKIFSWLSEGD
jgi:putative chitinase